METSTLNEHLSRLEVAELFKVHPVTVSKWAERNLLPYFTTPGGVRRFYRSDVEAFMARNTTVRAS